MVDFITNASPSTFNGFSYNVNIKKRTMDIILEKAREILTPGYLKTLITEHGNTQVSERKYIDTFKSILDDLGYTYTEASSQQPKDFRNINGIGLNIEMKKTDTFTIYFNDTLPNEDTEYIILFTGKEYATQNNIEPQMIHVNGDYFPNSSEDWVYEYAEKLEVLKNEYARGDSARNLSGWMSVYPRPTYKAKIRQLIL